MNVHLAYLETMFSAYPQTPRMLEAKRELQGMMEDAYAGFIADGLSENEAVGRVITEFGNLDEIAPVLGITAEIAPTPAAASGFEPAAAAPKYAPITLEEAQAFAEVRRTTQPRLAIAIALFVLSPIALLTAVALSDEGDSDPMIGLGLIPMLSIIAIGVIMIISVDQKRSAHKRISAKQFATNPAVNVWAHALESRQGSRRSGALQVAVGLWILSAAPILLTSTLVPDLGGEGKGSIFGVIGTLLLVAAGLLVFLPNNWAAEVAETVTKQGGAIGDSEDDNTSLVGVIASFYWPLLAVIFLAWSFIGDAWDRSWIVWPIGGVLFGVIAAGVGAIESYRKRR
ncbi:MAG: permease prefix domain 1-containing protein [Actinobacteria bacterium]|nr:permease prefix domain 1-containing protein [Actinomycetota bacterium]